ncbi:HAD family hydrolase [Pontibacter locisalis]|uniref:phosphoglycolate phosphatase n=1 Tax=Pontibacter locisalis TaxID=1719035 RepID=A0ABW5IML2_9BACT
MKDSIESIIFDLDGTLWDSTATIAAAWQEAVDQLDYVDRDITAEDVRGIAGMQYDAIYDKLFPSLKGKEREQLQKLCAKLELELLHERGGKLYPELEPTLKYLKEKYKLAIVSNCQSGYIEAFLKRHDLQPYFTDHECYGSRNLPKADNICEVIKRNNVQQAVYIGDTSGDFEASQKAQVPFILAAYGFGEVDAEVERIEKFSDLKRLF